ncbi:MAG: hypothetical protein FJ297_10745 [Planctomycetes bacterium]|nr:hypothetical protein [Planctomycetota bacterium]
MPDGLSGSPGYPGGQPNQRQSQAPKAPETFAEAATMEFGAGRHREAFQMLLAEFISNDSDARSNYEEMKYVAGLNRPVAAIRWGVGVDYQSGAYQGDPRPVGYGKQVAQTNRGQGGPPTGGGFEPGGVGAPGGFEPTGAGAGAGAAFGGGAPGLGIPGGPGGFPGAGGGGASPAGVSAISDPDIARTTGEVGDRVLEQLKSRVESGAFGAALKDYASIAPSSSPPSSGIGGFGADGEGFGGIPSGPGGFPGAPGGAPSGPGGFTRPSGPPGGVPSGPGGFAGKPGGGPGGFPGAPGGMPSMPGMPNFGRSNSASSGQGPRLLIPGIVGLGQAKTDELLKLAKAEELDVLLVFQVQVEENRRTKIVNNTVRFALYNVETGEMFKDIGVRAVNNIAVEKEREKRSDKDTIQDAVEQLFRFVDGPFALAAMPEPFGHDEAIERIRAVLAANNGRTLQNLNEVRFYRSRQWLSTDEMTKAYEHCLGGDVETASKLASGSEADKKKAMQGLLAKLAK